MTLHRIAEVILADVALRRSAPRVFLLDEHGTVLMWPSDGASAVPADLVPLLDMYFAQEPLQRGALSEVLDVGAARLTVRIAPYGAPGPSRYALVIEPFAIRSSRQSESGELSRAP